MINIIKLVCTIIGTFIGAGFASGKEIYSFFYKYGKYGIFGMILSSIMIGYIIYNTIRLCKTYNISEYSEFLDLVLNNKYIKNAFSSIIDIFFILSFCIMNAGFSAFLEQEFLVNKTISYIVLLSALYIILRKRSKGIIKINKIVIPIIIISMGFIFTQKVRGLNILEFAYPNKSGRCIKFFIKSVLYASYNLLTIIPIIVNMNNLCRKNKNIKILSFISSSIILILSIIIFIILGQTNIDIQYIEMPAVYIIGKYGVIYKNIFAFIIIASIITTIISCGYNYLQKYEYDNQLYNRKIWILIICSIISSKFGFSQMIDVLYPLFGAIALVQELFIIKAIRHNH